MSIVCDVYIDMGGNEATADGVTVTSAIMVNGTQMSGGAAGKWSFSPVTPTGLTIHAHQFPMYDTVTVRGVGSFAPGHTSRALRLDTTVGTCYSEIDLTSFAKSKVSMGGWMKTTVPFTSGPGALYDMWEIVAGITGNIVNLQLCDGTTIGGDYVLNSESTGGGSQHTTLVQSEVGKVTWCTIWADIINGQSAINVYAPDGTLISAATKSWTGSATDTSGTAHRWGNQEVGAAGGFLTFEHMVVDYTAATFPLIPSEWQGAVYPSGRSQNHVSARRA